MFNNFSATKSPAKLFNKLFLIGLCLVLIFSLGACGNGQNNNNGDDPDKGPDISQAEPIDEVTETVIDMVLEAIKDDISWAKDIYLAENEPDSPNIEDIRINTIEYKGQASYEDSVAAAFLIEMDVYYEDSGWGEYVPFYVVLERTSDNEGWLEAVGISYDSLEDKDAEILILEAVYRIWDLEVSVVFDGFTQYVGPGGTSIDLDEDHETEFHFDYEPVYNDGDHWLSYYYDGMEVLNYYIADEGVSRISALYITRDDCQTYRGIRVGSSKDEVLAAYPEIHQDLFWGEDDHMWYNTSEYGMGVGINLILRFEDDQVVQMELINMFN